MTAKQQLSRNPQNVGYSTPVKTYSVPASENEDKTISVPASPVFGIDPNREPIDLYMASRTVPGGTGAFTSSADLITNPGVTLLACPANVKYELQAVISDTVATATAGNRILNTRIMNSAGTVQWIGTASTAVTAAQTGGYDLCFGIVGTPSTTVRRNLANTANTNVQVRDFCPIKTLLPGWSLVLDDQADIDAADVVTHKTTYTSYPL